MLTLLDLMDAAQECPPEQTQEPPQDGLPFRIESISRYNRYGGGVYSLTRLVCRGCLVCGGRLEARNYCEWCMAFAYQWARERHLLRGVLRFEPYKYALKIDKTKNLKKSGGKHLYHEVNFNRDFEAHAVSVMIYWTNPVTRRYEVFPASGEGRPYYQTLCFKNMAEATAYLGRTVGDNLADWWK
jgi:hypothetical protein